MTRPGTPGRPSTRSAARRAWRTTPGGTRRRRPTRPGGPGSPSPTGPVVGPSPPRALVPLGDFEPHPPTSSDQRSPVVGAGADGAFVVAWGGPDAGNPGIYARRFAADGP